MYIHLYMYISINMYTYLHMYIKICDLRVEFMKQDVRVQDVHEVAMV